MEVFYNGHWGTVCDDDWTMANAHVVCRQLERGSAITTYRISYFGQGTGDIVLDDVVCQGHEQRLIDCQSTQGRDQHNCDHSEDVGVKCEHGVYLCVFYSHFLYLYLTPKLDGKLMAL